MRRSIHAAAAMAVALAVPSYALDCAAPATSVGKALCTDPKLKSANDEMAVALQAVLPLVGSTMAKQLTENQDAWETSLEERCGENAVTDETRADCILPEIGKRTAFFMASPVSGPGAPDRLLPYVYTQKHSEEMCAGTVETFDFGLNGRMPGERAFTESVHKLIEILDKGDFARDESNDPDESCAFSIYDAVVTYASPSLVAVNMPSFFDDDAKDGHHDQHSVVTDLTAGKTLAFADVFPDSAKPTIIADCTRQLREQRISGTGHQQGETEPPQPQDPPTADWTELVDRELKETYAATIAERVGDLRHWIIYADRAEVYFPEQSIGSNVEGNFACSFTNAQLAAYAGDKGWIVK